MTVSKKIAWACVAAVITAAAALWTFGDVIWGDGAERAAGAKTASAPEATADPAEFAEFGEEATDEDEGEKEPVAEAEERSDEAVPSKDAREKSAKDVPTEIEVVEDGEEPVFGPESKTPRSSETARPGQQGKSRKREEYQPAVLRVVTNFDKADVTVNGMPYPEYTQGGEEPGMVLPAGGPYTVQVTFDGKTKTYTLSLRPYEHRMLMVELTGFKGGGVAPSSYNSSTSNNAYNNDNENSGQGRVTVYSKPKGTIHVDGGPRKQKTPGTIKVPAGRHDIQVEFEGGKMSESKTVRVREGSRIKLFFRKK